MSKGYHKRNYWEKIRQIQSITLEYQRKGYFNEWIYKELIQPKYLISRATFYSYLGVNIFLEQRKADAAKHPLKNG